MTFMCPLRYVWDRENKNYSALLYRYIYMERILLNVFTKCNLYISSDTTVAILVGKITLFDYPIIHNVLEKEFRRVLESTD